MLCVEPNITSVMYPGGPLSGNFNVSIYGQFSEYAPIRRVSLANVPATILEQNSSVVTVRAGASTIARVGDVTMSDSYGNFVTCKDGFTYYARMCRSILCGWSERIRL